MKEIWLKAKQENSILHFKNFQTPDITWEDVLTFIYKESFKNPRWDNGYLVSYNHNLFPSFNGVSELMDKVNGFTDSKNCQYYFQEALQANCSCNGLWHIQALRFSIGMHDVKRHKDPNDVLYWQILGKSYWKINGDKTYELEPGDLFYFNQNDDHEVFQDGPRAGIIIDGRKQ